MRCPHHGFDLSRAGLAFFQGEQSLVERGNVRVHLGLEQLKHRRIDLVRVKTAHKSPVQVVRWCPLTS